MKLEISLSQKQILSQRMQYSLKILQMGALELERLICESALENPLIELEEHIDSQAVAKDQITQRTQITDESFSNYHTIKLERDAPGEPAQANRTGQTLREALLTQLSCLSLDRAVEQRVRYLIYNLDSNGYLALPKDSLQAELGATIEELEYALEQLKRMEPPGVGASNLRECLLIQARRMPCSSELLISIIEGELDTLAKNQLAKVAKKKRVPIERVKHAREQLLTLNPKPGNGYASQDDISYIQPDILIEQTEGGFKILFGDRSQPRVKINSYYRELARDANCDVANYIGDRLDKAEWLISCIKQRKKTLLSCATGILERQHRFFKNGPGNLLPMTLADLADSLNIHPSTVSRAIRDKYLQCRWGVFALSYFFSRSVGYDTNGGTIGRSRDMAQMQIMLAIEGEEPRSPRSDSEIAAILQESGFPIARRTVAKYRERMGIPPAIGRKAF